MLYKTYLTCTSHPELNKYLEANIVREIDSTSPWDAIGDIVQEAGDKLLQVKGDLKRVELDARCRIEEHRVITKYLAIISFEKETIIIDHGFHIPENDALQEIFPTKIENDFTFELIDKGNAPDGPFPGEVI